MFVVVFAYRNEFKIDAAVHVEQQTRFFLTVLKAMNPSDAG